MGFVCLFDIASRSSLKRENASEKRARGPLPHFSMSPLRHHGDSRFSSDCHF
jgi:hypothetical protein